MMTYTGFGFLLVIANASRHLGNLYVLNADEFNVALFGRESKIRSKSVQGHHEIKIKD